MGMVFANVTFHGRAPSLSDICATISEISSQPVIVLSSEDDEIHDLKNKGEKLVHKGQELQVQMEEVLL